MSKAPQAAAKIVPTEGEGVAASAKGGRKKLLLIVAPVALLIITCGGLWFTGILPSMLGIGAKPSMPSAEMAGMKQTVFVDLPEIISNLNSGSKRPAFVKMKVKIELAKAEDQPLVMAEMPRLLDLLQTYLRETRPDELRGAEGTWRLRRELVARADIAVAPAHVNDVLFTEMLVQ